MKSTWKTWFITSLLIFGTLALLDARMNATASLKHETLAFDVSEPVSAVLSVAVRDLPPADEPHLSRETNPIQWLGDGVGNEGVSIGLDPLASNGVNGGQTPDPLVTFEGVPSIAGVTPPDTDGDVGPNHYIQMTNFHFQIWDKGDPDNGIPPTSLIAPTALGSLFSTIGGGCQSNHGDPVVLYDDMADRWVLTQFNLSSLGQCFAISTTPDPLGTYYLYNISTPAFPDYPKIGVWPDAYYMGTNTGSPNQYYAHAFDRVAMLAGAPATRQSFGSLPNLMMPADVDGQLPPPAGDPGIFYTYYHPSGGGHPPGDERLAIYEFDVDWVTPGNSTYTLVEELLVAPFNYTVCGFFSECVPQPGTSQLLHDLSWWPMFRFQYRNFDSYEAMVGNFTVDLDGTNKAAIRWFEVRKTSGGYTLYQEGTYAPDSSHRWMGSIAMDGSGHIALGYSVSNPTTGIKPSIRIATRLQNDPLGTLAAEAEMWTGGGVQTGIHRWGDYSALTVDPVDNCTFWFTTEYHDVDDSGFGWNTRIGVFRVPECTGGLGPDFDVEVVPEQLDACILSDSSPVNVNLEWLEGYSLPVTLSAVGVPAGYSADFSINPVVSPTMTSELTFISTGAATAGSYLVDIVGVGTPTPTHTATLTLNLYDPITSAPVLLTPTDGETGVSTAPTFTWSPVAGATSYNLEIAEDPAFNNIVFSTTGITQTTYGLTIALDELHTYYWRVQASNVCGDASVYSATFSFTTRDVPAILLVDDDDNSPNVRNYYTAALDDLGWTYDVWNTENSDDEPTATDLAPYSAVIWFTGDEVGGAAGPGDTGETALSTWLDNTQGCFFISSQDYFDDRGLTPFMTDYLGAATITEDNGDYSQVTGQGAVYSSLGTRSLLYPFTDSADWITPDGTAEMGIIGTNGRGAALTKDDGYKTTFWVFPLESIFGVPNRRNAIDAFITWCGLELPFNGVELSADQAETAPAGTTVTYTLSVTNTGNVADIVNLTLSGNVWTTTLSTPSLSLNAGETATFTVAVTVPEEAEIGATDTVTVTATSQTDGTATDTATLTTTAEAPEPETFDVFLPIIVYNE